MKICYIDAFPGISGDMTVGVLVDAGADTERIRAGLNSLNTGASFSFEQTRRRGIAATKFQVHGGEQRNHRHLPEILKMIDDADLPERAKRNATAVFKCLGEAEAAIHGVAIEKVHFHEVGAVDSICDIVAACHALSCLRSKRYIRPPSTLEEGCNHRIFVASAKFGPPPAGRGRPPAYLSDSDRTRMFRNLTISGWLFVTPRPALIGKLSSRSLSPWTWRPKKPFAWVL